MVAILEKIRLDDFSVGGECDLFHHGKVWDYLRRNSFEFHTGNLYGIIGEFGCGGASLSCVMTGNIDYDEGKVYIDGQESPLEHVIENSWYVGMDLDNRKRFIKKRRTVRQQIEYGVHNTKQRGDAKKIQGIFRISEERIDRNIKYVSGECWKASAAIGYANGRKIFCYPWMNSRDVEHLKEQLSYVVDYLIHSDCIVIFPTTKEDNIKKICSEYKLYYLE